MKHEQINGARSLRIVPKQPANDPEMERQPLEKGDGWKVIGLAVWPIGLVCIGYVVALVGIELGWWL